MEGSDLLNVKNGKNSIACSSIIDLKCLKRILISQLETRLLFHLITCNDCTLIAHLVQAYLRSPPNHKPISILNSINNMIQMLPVVLKWTTFSIAQNLIEVEYWISPHIHQFLVISTQVSIPVCSQISPKTLAFLILRRKTRKERKNLFTEEGQREIKTTIHYLIPNQMTKNLKGIRKNQFLTLQVLEVIIQSRIWLHLLISGVQTMVLKKWAMMYDSRVILKWHRDRRVEEEEEEDNQSYLINIFRIPWVKMIPDKFKIFEDYNHNLMMIKINE